MLRRLVVALLLAGSVLIGAVPAEAQKSFVDDHLASEAIRLEAQVKDAGRRGEVRPAALARREAETALGRGNARAALNHAQAALAAEPGDGRNWLAYARAARALEPRDWSERNALHQRMTAAAYAAYQRAATKRDEAAALAVLAETFAVRELWRPALNAYRASLEHADDPAVRRTYEALRETHGFRVTDFKVDSDAASPRVCFQFSDPLASGKLDFAPFVAVAGTASAAVTADDMQVCVDGLKHGERYSIVLRQGLPSAVGESLLRPASYEIYVRDRAPQVRFTGRNYVLPRTAQEGIPVISVNTAKVAVEIFRIGDRSLAPTVRSDEFLAQLGRYAADQIADEKGVKIWSGTLDTAADLNRDVVTAFPVLAALGPVEPGVYVMTARPQTGVSPQDADDEGNRATQWFVVSDLGLTAFKGSDGVHVFVRSLATAAPVGNVELRLVARNNEVLATRTTDASGHAAFGPGLARGEGGLAPGIMVASLGTDYGFLDLGASAFDLTDRGVKGRPAGGAVDAYVFTERGVYRTGETVFATALLRDAQGVAIAGAPLTMVVRRPDGVEYRRTAVEDQGLGGRTLAVPILPGAMRGTWRVAAYTDPKGRAVGEASFLVEDYVPERLEVALTPKQPALRPGEAAEIDLSARYLFGAPGGHLDVSGEVTVAAAAAHGVRGLEGFSVGLDDESLEAVTTEIAEAPATDAQGRARIRVPVPAVAAPRPTEARIALRVAEPGGRAVERSLTLPILPRGPVVGVRRNFGSDLADGAMATFDVALAAPDGTRLSRKGVAWSLYRVEQTHQWFNADGRWGYEPVRATRRVADGRIDVSEAEAARIAVPVQWGSYRLEIGAPELGESAHTSVSFSVGWSGERTADAPDLLEMALDKASYRTGERMEVRLSPRFAGKATLAVVGEKVHELRVIDLAAGAASVSLEVRSEWGAGAYVVALAHRPLDQAARRQPGRALGVAWFAVDREARALQVDLAAPAQARPRGALKLPVKVGGLAPGEEALITVAAVDVGILNLTRYKAPDPFEHYFSQRQLSTEIRDLYGYLIDGMQGTRGQIRSGGDVEAATLEGAPPTQEPLALFSGIVRVAADGSAAVEFDLPAFNGTVRVMATAWTRDRLGAAQADIVVRDPVVLAGTLPRFLSVGDQTRLSIQVENVEGPAGEYVLTAEPEGPVSVPADALRTRVRLEANGRASVTVPIAATGWGTASFGVTIAGAGLEAGQRFALRVQPGTSPLLRRIVRPLQPGERLTVSADLLADILPGTGAVSVSVSPLAALDVPSLLQALDRYPYGCTEQIVSRALPLLSVNRLAAQEALALDASLDDRVRQSVERIIARQDANGSFGLWSAGGNDLWLDAYATDFLTRARERGFTVPQVAFDLALDRLRNFVANTTDVEGNAPEIAYAAYVLARNGRAAMGDLRYLADAKIAAFATPLARGQIAAGLALLGDRTRAKAAFAAALQRLRETRDDGSYRADYGSRLRDGAGLLALAAEVEGGRESVQPITRVVAEERASSRRTSTQENAWMVLAAEALMPDAAAISLEIDGAERTGAFFRTYPDAALTGNGVAMANTGAAAVQVVLGVAGHPTGFEPPLAQGYAVERSYYRLDGTRADPARMRQNDRLVTVLKVTEAHAKAARLLLVDRLPAGVEIDNPRLVDGDALSGLSWLKTDVEPAHVEYRDDRFVAAFDRSPDQGASFTVAYVVRAVSPGRYVHPPAHAEDMYAPERFGRTAFGTVEIAPARP